MPSNTNNNCQSTSINGSQSLRKNKTKKHTCRFAIAHDYYDAFPLNTWHMTLLKQQALYHDWIIHLDLPTRKYIYYCKQTIFRKNPTNGSSTFMTDLRCTLADSLWTFFSLLNISYTHPVMPPWKSPEEVLKINSTHPALGTYAMWQCGVGRMLQSSY